MASPDLPLLTPATLRAGVRFLRARDRSIGEWMARIGTVPLRRQRPYFLALAKSIVSQQLAAKAAKSIWGRLVELFDGDPLSPEGLLALADEELRGAGLSRPKASYLRALAEAFTDGDLRGARFARLANDEVIERLTRVKGIGVWTAEMFLIFSLGRADVYSEGDLALRAGVQRVAGRELTAREAAAHAERWSPWRSVASLYLWRIAHWQE